MISLHVKKTLLLGVLLVGAGQAMADIATYNDAAAFDSAITLSGVDMFFGVLQDAAGSNPMNRRTQLGETYSYVAVATGSSLIGAGDADETWLTANDATDTITFSNFSTGITAFGGYFFGSDFNGQYQLGTVTLEVTDATGSTFKQTLTDATSSSFLGFVSKGANIASISLYSEPLDSGDSVWPTARLLTMGQAVSAVPELSSALMLLLGLPFLALLRRS